MSGRYLRAAIIMSTFSDHSLSVVFLLCDCYPVQYVVALVVCVIASESVFRVTTVAGPGSGRGVAAAALSGRRVS